MFICAYKKTGKEYIKILTVWMWGCGWFYFLLLTYYFLTFLLSFGADWEEVSEVSRYELVV